MSGQFITFFLISFIIFIGYLSSFSTFLPRQCFIFLNYFSFTNDFTRNKDTLVVLTLYQSWLVYVLLCSVVVSCTRGGQIISIVCLYLQNSNGISCQVISMDSAKCINCHSESQISNFPSIYHQGAVQHPDIFKWRRLDRQAFKNFFFFLTSLSGPQCRLSMFGK